MDNISPKTITPTKAGVSPTKEGQIDSNAQAKSSAQPSQAQASQNTNTQAASQQALQNTVNQLTSLLKAQGSVNAKVQSSQVLDQPAQKLLQQVNPDLAAKISNSTTSNATNNTVNSTINNTPGNIQNQVLYLIKLINTQTQQPLLTTISKTPFKTGTELSLQLNQQQQIVIKPDIKHIQHSIVSNLKQTISQQSPNNILFQAINSLLALPKTQQQQLLNTETVKVLQVIQKTQTLVANTSENKSASSELKSLITNSGIFTENKITQGANIQSDIRLLLFQLTQSLNPTSNITTPSNSTLTIDKPTQSLLQLLGISINKPTVETLPVKEKLQQQLKVLAQQIQERVQFNQIRSLLGESNGNDGTPIKQQNMHIDIPLRWGDQTLPLHLNIYAEAEKIKDDQSNREDEEKNEENKTLNKCWHVVLSFELPGKEVLDAQLTVINDTVSATFWSESSELYQEIKDSLDQLRKKFLDNNLQVDELQCISGKAPMDKFSLDYHLVDVVT